MQILWPETGYTQGMAVKLNTATDRDRHCERSK